MAKEKDDKKRKGEEEMPEPRPVKKPAAPPTPVGIPVSGLALGAKFIMGGAVYRKDSGPGNRIIGTRLIKTPTTGDTWIAGDQQILPPETLVDPY